MKRVIVWISFILGLFSLGLSFAKNQNGSDKTALQMPIIPVYQDANVKSSVIERVPLFNNFIAIYQKDLWIKVGDTKTGQVGWINREDFRTAVKTFYQQFKPTTQTVIIQQSISDNSFNKNVVAYKDGKKLSPQDAQALYTRLQAQLRQEKHAQLQYMNRMFGMFRQMDRLMDTQMHIYRLEPTFSFNVGSLIDDDAAESSGVRN